MEPQLHVLPWLRRPAQRLMRHWLAITLGDHTFSWRPLSAPELAHEACHATQWRAHGLRLIPRYLRASWWAWRAGGDWYRDNRFEREARAAATRAGG